MSTPLKTHPGCELTVAFQVDEHAMRRFRRTRGGLLPSRKGLAAVIARVRKAGLSAFLPEGRRGERLDPVEGIERS